MIRLEFDPPLARCPLCRSDRISDFDHDDLGVSISRCTSCRIKFMNPQYTDRYLEGFYSGYIGDGYHASEEDRNRRRARKSQSLDLIEESVRPGELLSVGTGDGMELQLARARGWKITGYDVHGPTTERLARELGCTVLTGDLYTLPALEGRFDCVYLDQVLEHPKDPRRMLRFVRTLLSPGGVAYFGVPNIESLANRAKTLWGKLGLKKRRGKHYDTFHHLFYYAPSTLPDLMERLYGYEVLEVAGDPYPSGGVGRFADACKRRFPVLDSSFCVLARAAQR